MNNQKYPTVKVILGYALLGGIVGGFPLLPFIILSILEDLSNIRVLFGLVFPFVVGFIPALITGIVLAYFKIAIKNKIDYFKPFWIGFGVTYLCFASIPIVWMFFGDINNEALLYLIWNLAGYLLLALIGGVSSVILAKFLLPKN